MEREAKQLEQDLVASLRRLSPGAGSRHWDEFTYGLRQLLGVSAASVYGLSRFGHETVTTFVHGSGVEQPRLRRMVDTIAAESGLRLFDPLKVSAEHANSLVTVDRLIEAGQFSDEAWAAVRARFERDLGLTTEDQLRVVVTEGRTMLAWVGCLRSPHDRLFDASSEAALRRLLPVIRDRLILDERLRRGPLVAAALDAALVLFDEPVLLVDERGRPVMFNPVAQRLWDANTGLREEVADAVAGRGGPFRITEVRSEAIPRHLLLVRRGDDRGALARRTGAERDWRLTPRESEVLALVVQGLTNAAIARDLDCAERTVELHVTRLLVKSLSDNRATLIARFWTGGARVSGRLPAQMEQRARDLRAELATWRASGPEGWTTTSELLAESLGAVSLLYEPADSARPFRVVGTHGTDLQRAQEALTALTSSMTYDPAGVPAKKRNRVSLKEDLVNKGDFTPEKRERWWHVSRSVLGNPILDQLRLLVCEGPTALAWVGAVQFDPDRPFAERDRRFMQHVAPAFIERVQLNARLEREPLAEVTLEALLSQTEQPTWLLDARGAVVLSNAAASARWDRRPTDTADALERVARGDARGFRIADVRVPGLPRYQLVMARGDLADAGARLEWAVSTWGLSPPEATLLACVVRGLTTEAIATELHRSRRTVELYVTRLMEKARVDNRATLIAKVWSGT